MEISFHMDNQVTGSMQCRKLLISNEPVTVHLPQNPNHRPASLHLGVLDSPRLSLSSGIFVRYSPQHYLQLHAFHADETISSSFIFRQSDDPHFGIT